MRTIDPSCYMRQPQEWRDRMDAWLADAGLPKNCVKNVHYGDDGVVIDAYERDDDDNIVVERDESGRVVDVVLTTRSIDAPPPPKPVNP